jgi:hypothetical protein
LAGEHVAKCAFAAYCGYFAYEAGGGPSAGAGVGGYAGGEFGYFGLLLLHFVFPYLGWVCVCVLLFVYSGCLLEGGKVWLRLGGSGGQCGERRRLYGGGCLRGCYGPGHGACEEYGALVERADGAYYFGAVCFFKEILKDKDYIYGYYQPCIGACD